jgi:hypothetical protein
VFERFEVTNGLSAFLSSQDRFKYDQIANMWLKYDDFYSQFELRSSVIGLFLCVGSGKTCACY